jgi:hypothetical protein
MMHCIRLLENVERYSVEIKLKIKLILLIENLKGYWVYLIGE